MSCPAGCFLGPWSTLGSLMVSSSGTARLCLLAWTPCCSTIKEPGYPVFNREGRRGGIQFQPFYLSLDNPTQSVKKLTKLWILLGSRCIFQIRGLLRNRYGLFIPACSHSSFSFPCPGSSTASYGMWNRCVAPEVINPLDLDFPFLIGSFISSYFAEHHPRLWPTWLPSGSYTYPSLRSPRPGSCGCALPTFSTPVSAFCFHKRSVKSFPFRCSPQQHLHIFLEPLQRAVPSILSSQTFSPPLFSALCTSSASPRAWTLGGVTQHLAGSPPWSWAHCCIPLRKLIRGSPPVFIPACSHSSGTSARHLYICSLQSSFWWRR